MSSLWHRLEQVQVTAQIKQASGHLAVGEINQAAAAMLAAWLRDAGERHVVVVTTEPDAMFSDLLFWSGGKRIGLFVAADTLPFDRVALGDEATRNRLNCLALLSQGPSVIVASPSSLLRPTLSPAEFAGQLLLLRAGDVIEPTEVMMALVTSGYESVVAVCNPGECAVRGGIVDVYPIDAAAPVRLEWLGKEIEAVRSFDASTQSSIGALGEIAIPPAHEFVLSEERIAAALRSISSLGVSSLREDVAEIWERDIAHLRGAGYCEGLDRFFPYLNSRASLLDHASGAQVLLVGGEDHLVRHSNRFISEASDVFQQEVKRGEVPKGSSTGLLDYHDLIRSSGLKSIIETSQAGSGEVLLGWGTAASVVGELERFFDSTKEKARAANVLIASLQGSRVSELLEERKVGVQLIDDFSGTSEVPGVGLLMVGQSLSAGFTAPNLGLETYSDFEIFGAQRRRGALAARGARRAISTSAKRGSRRVATGSAAREAFVLDFQPGDVVVHRDHGIGRFLEMRKVDDEAGTHEYMALEYADGNKLLVPVEHLDRIDRYIGPSDQEVHLSRLGTGEWDKAKRRVKERAEAVARDLLELYSNREVTPGHAFAPDSGWQMELESSFPYQETPDQLSVMEEIKRDMEISHPMDRLVCGDVGFGKTELAIRAAFKAVNEGYQVAVLVPTTILAQQHFETFRSRLAAFPIEVRQLSRFVSDSEINQTLAGLGTGTVDIVIGTHRLLQTDVRYHNLGLLVIDEEQRFGVLQKERLKAIRVAVDVLSLSATPIPRTLQMSLAGIRDLSVIQTPPEERQPIKTYVTADDDELIHEVITRELARGGQAYYLHNRVASIQKEAERLAKLVPDARVEFAHGQMPEKTLVDTMKRFIDGEIDVLVCTTIIEAGLDIPNVNSIIIKDAHRLGLSQLYQLRGRVGRAGQRAYAYLLYPPSKSLTEKADKRLDVMSELQDLGVGFKIAMRDLEIRGAGNLLGEEQHGEIAAVGLELYNHLLRQAVLTLQGKPLQERPAPVTIVLPIKAYLPSDYIREEELRLRAYQDLAACIDDRELDQAAAKLEDRFGPLPALGKSLLFSLKVRLLAGQARVKEIKESEGKLVIQLPHTEGFQLAKIASQFSGLRATASQLHLTVSQRWEDDLVHILQELKRQVGALHPVQV